MKYFFKYLGLLTILLGSFYYTEKMSRNVINNSSLVKEINNNSEKYKVNPVSATIEDNYIIPGLNGYAVNVLKSYNNMRFLDTFNSYYLEYDKIFPNISLENNKDKIIKYGNKNKKGITLLISNNTNIINYAKLKDINITRLIDIDSFDKNLQFEQINNDDLNFKKVELLLNNANINKNICLVNEKNIEICREEKKYLVESSYILNNYNIISVLDTIKSGYILYINDSVSLDDFKILIKQINYHDLKILSLSEMISEERQES